MTRRGRLVVHAKFHVPVTMQFYRTTCGKDVQDITAQDIIGVETDNFASNPDSYQEMLFAYLESLTFELEEFISEEEDDDGNHSG